METALIYRRTFRSLGLSELFGEVSDQDRYLEVAGEAFKTLQT